MDAFAILSLAIGLFGATFAALASIQRFFSSYINIAWKRAGPRLKNIRDSGKGNVTKAIACRYAVAICYVLWNLTLFATILIFGYFAFKFSSDALKCKDIVDTTNLWANYLGDIIFMRKSFIWLFCLGIIFLVVIFITNSILAGMSEMVEPQSTEEGFKGQG